MFGLDKHLHFLSQVILVMQCGAMHKFPHSYTKCFHRAPQAEKDKISSTVIHLVAVSEHICLWSALVQAFNSRTGPLFIC